MRRILTRTVKTSGLYSLVVEEDNNRYYAEVYLEDKLHNREGPYFDQDEAEARSDILRYDAFKAGWGKRND